MCKSIEVGSGGALVGGGEVTLFQTRVLAIYKVSHWLLSEVLKRKTLL